MSFNLLSELAGRSVNLSAEAVAAVESYSWPGNVRELREVLRSALSVGGRGPIMQEHLPDAVRTAVGRAAPRWGAADEMSTLAQTKRVPIYGIDYKDKGEAGADWIKTLGNPYTKVGADTGRVGIDWGVYGVPETFVVDRAGRIRYKHVGPLTEEDIQRTILPLVAKLDK